MELASPYLALRLRWWSARRIGLWLARPCIRQPTEMKQGQVGQDVKRAEFVLSVWQPSCWEPSHHGCLLTARKREASMGTWAGGRVGQPWLGRRATTRSHIRHARAWTTWRAGQRWLWCGSLARHSTSTCSQVGSLSEIRGWPCQRVKGPLVRGSGWAFHLHLRPVGQFPRDRWLAVSTPLVRIPGWATHLGLQGGRQPGERVSAMQQGQRRVGSRVQSSGWHR